MHTFHKLPNLLMRYHNNSRKKLQYTSQVRGSQPPRKRTANTSSGAESAFQDSRLILDGLSLEWVGLNVTMHTHTHTFLLQMSCTGGTRHGTTQGHPRGPSREKSRTPSAEIQFEIQKSNLKSRNPEIHFEIQKSTPKSRNPL